MTRGCNHILEPKDVDHFRTDWFCTKCGELIGWTEDLHRSPDTYVTGTPRKLTNREKMDLR